MIMSEPVMDAAMSFQKAADLLRLAEMATSRHLGVGLADIESEFAVDRRTAQRMTKALEETFPNYVTRTDDERRKYWKINFNEAKLMLAQGLRDSELAALEISIVRAERDGASNEVRSLRGLRDRLLANMPGSHARRAEADAEAVLEAYGFASRPGPRVRASLDLLGTVAEALKGPHQLTVIYAGGRDPSRERLLEPHGLLLGTRRYLVAREVGGDGRMQHFRFDRITSARLEASSFQRDPAFNLPDHSARAFGSYHAEKEYGEVIWRFNPAAAPVAREFLFHPQQVAEENTDGSLTIRFHASGQMEMAWHLYQWGDAVEVLAPAALRDLIAMHRRGDFAALP
jgi:predicted DNA-binding transcriptional regulator YafY